MRFLHFQFVCLFFISTSLSQVALGQQPYIKGSFPNDGAKYLLCNAFLSASLHFPDEGLHVNEETLTQENVRLFIDGTPSKSIRTELAYNTTYKYIGIRPLEVLTPNTSYTFEITSGLTDERGTPFMPFRLDFSTGACYDSSKTASRGLPPKKEKPIPAQAFSNLSTFQADLMKDSILVTWQTTGEFNIKGYIVERSINGEDFDSLCFVSSKGDNEKAQGYISPDHNSPWGKNYYRLRISDKSGDFWYSEIVEVFKQKLQFSSTRIPQGGELVMNIHVAPQTSMVFLLKNRHGQVVRRKAGFMPWQKDELRISLANVPPGKYKVILLTPKSRIAKIIRVIEEKPIQEE